MPSGGTSRGWTKTPSYYLDDDFDVSIDTSDELYEKPEHFLENMSPSEIQKEIAQEIENSERSRNSPQTNCTQCPVGPANSNQLSNWLRQ